MQHHGGAKSSSSLSLFHAMKGTSSRIDKQDIIISALSLSASTSTTALYSATTNQHSKTNNSNSNSNSNSSSNNQNSWLDRTTARLLDMPTTTTTTTKKYFDQKLFNEQDIDDETGTTSTFSSDITPNTQQHQQHQQNHQNQQQNNQSLSPDDVNLITTLMASHARRSTIESAIICEQLLKRVVDEVDMNARHNLDDDNDNDDGGVRVTTKMYTVGKD